MSLNVKIDHYNGGWCKEIKKRFNFNFLNVWKPKFDAIMKRVSTKATKVAVADETGITNLGRDLKQNSSKTKSPK